MTNRPKKRSLHISTVRRVRSLQAIYGKYREPRYWEMHCNCGEHYMTDAGWQDAMAWSLAHRTNWDWEREAMRIQSANIGWNLSRTF